MKRAFSAVVTAIIVLLVLSNATTTTFAQKKPVKPDWKGFDTFVEQQLKEWDVPGAAVAVVKDGEVLFAKGYGLRDVKNKKPMTAQTLLAIGSCTKAFTSMTVGMLVDEGKMKWDTPAREYLPSLKFYDEYTTNHITLRDMLSHRSGLPRHDFAWYGAQDTSIAARKTLVESIRYLKPNKELRELWQYNNFMFLTAGYLVQAVTGSAWEDVAKRRILEPLGMTATNFSVTEMVKTSDYALPYQKKKENDKEFVKEIPFKNIDPIAPAGSINSSVQDMAHWVTAQLAGGKWKDKQVLPAAAVLETQKPLTVATGTMDFDESSYVTYGLGWFQNVYRGHLRVYHGGNIDGFSAGIQLLPRDSIGIVVLTNLNSTPLPSIIASNALDRLFGLDEVNWSKRSKEREAKAKAEADKKLKESDKQRVADTKPSHSLIHYIGNFENPAYGSLSVVQQDYSLELQFHGIVIPLKHYHYDVFQAMHEEFENLKTTFEMNPQGDIARVLVGFEPASDAIVFTRVADKAMSDKVFLEKLTGEYTLAGQVVTVATRGETLTVTVPGQPTYELVPVKDTRFDLKGLNGFSLEFTLPSGAQKAIEASFLQPNGTFTAKRK